MSEYILSMAERLLAKIGAQAGEKVLVNAATTRLIVEGLVKPIESDQLAMAALVADADGAQAGYATMAKIVHNQVVANQSAWIEWRRGKGADAAMQWIENGLFGPGHIPGETEPYAFDAQFWHDANQADPFPTCRCGKPSHILCMGIGACSQECLEQAQTERGARDAE